MHKPAIWLLGLVMVVAASAVAIPVSAATAYTSPTYGYSITLPDEWTVQSQTSDNGTDVLRFTNGPVVAFLTSYATEQTPAECIEAMVETIEQRPRHDNFAYVSPIAESPGSATAVFGYTFITAAGEQLEGRNRMTCWSLDGAMVRLEMLLLSRDVVAQEAAMTAIETEVAAAIQPAGSVPEASPIATATVVEIPTNVPPATEEAQATETPLAADPTETSESDAAPEETATETPGESLAPELEPGISGNTYVSPTYGYGLTWGPEWSVVDELSDTRGDYLGLEHSDGVFADLIGEAYPVDRGGCFDFIVDYYTQHEDYRNVVGTMDPTSAAPGLWEFTGTVAVLYISESGNEVELLNYVSCSHIPGQSAIVSLEQVVLPADLAVLQPEMDALRQGFVLSTTVAPFEGDASPAPTEVAPTEAAPTEAAPSPSPAVTEEATQTAGSGPVGTGGVTDNTYVSPSWNYRLTWNESWTVVGENTENGEDYLNLSNGNVVAELLSERWTPGEENCFEWIVSFYAGHPDWSDVRASQDAVSAVPGVWDYTGAIALNLLVSDDRPAGERINYVACSEIPGEGVIVSLEQFVWPIEAPGYLAVMDELREGFSLDGSS